MLKTLGLNTVLILAISACSEQPKDAASVSYTSEPDAAVAEETTVELTASTTTAAFRKEFDLHGVGFLVEASNNGSINTLSITPNGLTVVNDGITREIDGTVTDAEVADINGDLSPEIYVWVNSAGSGSYATPIGYSANNNKSLSEIYFPSISEDPVNSNGYMGHDQFRVVENSVVQRFPLYNESDTNASPSGKTRQLVYKLTPSEAGWVMKLDSTTEF